MQAPDLELAHAQLPGVLRLLTQISLESMADLVPDRADGDALMAEHFERVSMICSQVQLDADRMNPRWNKTYGQGGTYWQGALQDNRDRGGIPYYCPQGWVRFALNVCQDAEFEERFTGWGYLYHGTKGRFVGSILTSGFRASKGLCFCGKDDHAVYMSPSIEYCSHPRYGTVEYNPETRQWMQVVLQCRVDPKAIWQKQPETLHCAAFGIKVDDNVSNDTLEWLFKPNYTDPSSGDKYIQDAIVCTGVMIRVTKEHPLDLPLWWAKDAAYGQRLKLRETKVDPLQKALKDPSWTAYQNSLMVVCTYEGDPCEMSFKVVESCKDIGTTFMAPAPFANGSMRYAWYLQTSAGLFVVKSYNDELARHIQEGLGSETQYMVKRDVSTYLAAQYYADKLVDLRDSKKVGWNWNIKFVPPCAFRLGKVWYFGEQHLNGKFLKWNTNTGENNLTAEASKDYLDLVAAFFSHFTYDASKGKMMVVDIQGLVDKQSVTLMDPQIHTRSFKPGTRDRKSDALFQRFSVGNLGKTGMMRFFAKHKCNNTCKAFGLVHPRNSPC